MFSWEILTDNEHITDQNNHFRQYWTFSKIRRSGLGKSQNANFCIKIFLDMFSWEILTDYEHITDQKIHFHQYCTYLPPY